MSQQPVWLDAAALLALHDEQLSEHGGARGIRDQGPFDSAMARPENAHAYGETSLFTMAALYAGGIIRNHPFVDGNKRTGFIAAALFLDLNGFDIETSQDDVVRTVLDLASGTMDEANFARWLDAVSHPLKGDY